MKIITKIIQGIEYQAVWKGLKFSEECSEQCVLENTDTISLKLLADVIFSDVIISPKVNIDDFTDMAEFLEVYEFGKNVLFGTFEENKTKTELRQKVKKDWGLWRLILSDIGFDYHTVFYEMTPQDVLEANIALDLKIEAEKKAMKRKR